MKVILISTTVVLLVVVAVLVFRFIQGTIFAATEALQQLGEAPIVDEQQVEEKWVAPEMLDMSDYDIERGIDNVDEEGADIEVRLVDSDDDDVQAVRVEETADELADTVPDNLSDMDSLPPE